MTTKGDLHFRLRVPPHIQQSIAAAAAANRRSMNAEIVARLEGSSRTLRDEFAMEALTGMLLSDQATAAVVAKSKSASESPFEVSARLAYQFADAMLTQRSK